MFNEQLFNQALRKMGMSIETLAGKIGINAATLYRKKTQQSDFTRAEIQACREVLNLTAEEVDAIFFAE